MAANTLTFMIFLACLFPIALCATALTTTGSWPHLLDFFRVKLRKLSFEPFSLNKAHQSYSNYRRLATSEITSRRAIYNTLGRGHQRLGNAIGYTKKLDMLKIITEENALIAEKIAGLAAAEYGLGNPGAGNEDIGSVRESLKHFIRDWSTDGAMEREKIFRPILAILKAVDEGERMGCRVLLPGSGLGRLAWEISQLGYDTTANELSFFMNLAFRFLLSPETTTVPNEHILRPYAHWFSHQRSNQSLFRAIRFPDAIPRLGPTFRVVEADFLTLKPPSNISPNVVWSKSDPALREVGYDYIITLFFIDTSPNVLATMEHIYALLRPGGTWINLGPLLWGTWLNLGPLLLPSSGYAKVELSLDEVIQAAKEIGFVVHDGDATAGDLFARRTVESEYTADTNGLLRRVYKAEFWVATKSK